MTQTVGVHQAKTQLSRLLEAVERGEDVLITRRGHHVARLTREGLPTRRRSFGIDAGLWTVPPEFDEPLPDDIAAAFAGERPLPS
jgi:antitoxin (DNA-binding transcriptional repressor) of toxin-antitoxin stability system